MTQTVSLIDTKENKIIERVQTCGERIYVMQLKAKNLNRREGYKRYICRFE